MTGQTLAIDFGTSNSAAALPHPGGIYRVPIERGAETLPTAVFFPEDGATMRIGAAATQALITGAEGRYMRALKSVLGLPLLHETRLIAGKRRNLAEVIAAFLATLKARAEDATGLAFRHALSGRPVHFHSDDPAGDAQAEADLRACYHAAGFDSVTFLPEPEAAARACFGMGGAAGIGLIVDIGGGTSDFSVFQGSGAGHEILASHGIRLGGTDFDRKLSLAHAMPALGLGGQLRREMGPGLLPVPRAPYVDLATWARIPFLYSAETRRMVADMTRMAQEPARMARFATLLEHELGHDLAFAVERAKIAANASDGAQIDLTFLEPGLSRPLTARALAGSLADNRAALGQAASEVLTRAGVQPADVARVILVGGSSLMGLVQDEMAALCANAAMIQSEAFTAVVDGLTLSVADAC